MISWCCAGSCLKLSEIFCKLCMTVNCLKQAMKFKNSKLGLSAFPVDEDNIKKASWYKNKEKELDVCYDRNISDWEKRMLMQKLMVEVSSLNRLLLRRTRV